MTVLSFNPFRHRLLDNFASNQGNEKTANYVLKWRQKQLFLRKVAQAGDTPVKPPASLNWLVERLQHSPIYRVSLTPDLPVSELELWANACAEASKAVYLQVPNTAMLPKKRDRVFWWLKRALDWGSALLLTLILMPVMLALAICIRLQSPGPILFCQWRVGERGKLFRVFKFRTMIVGSEHLHEQVMGTQIGLCKCENDQRVTGLGRWLRKYSLDELPQLLNVLRGEMSLVGPRPWALYDAVRIRPAFRHRLNALPGMTGIWQITARSHLRDLDIVNQLDLGYLRHWSLTQDLKILLLTLPKVLTGYGAY